MWPLSSGVRPSKRRKFGSPCLPRELTSPYCSSRTHTAMACCDGTRPWSTASFNPYQDAIMSKGLNQKKKTKKAPAKTADEKRAAKREKAKKG